MALDRPPEVGDSQIRDPPRSAPLTPLTSECDIGLAQQRSSLPAPEVRAVFLVLEPVSQSNKIKMDKSGKYICM